MNDHFYTASQDGELAPRNGYKFEGISFYAFPRQTPGTIALIRMFGHGDHFYTTNEAEANIASSQHGYRREGILCYVYSSQQNGTWPLYRLYGNGDHFYTINEVEARLADRRSGYSREGIACYVYPSQQDGTIPIYRWWQAPPADVHTPVHTPTPAVNPPPPDTGEILWAVAGQRCAGGGAGTVVEARLTSDRHIKGFSVIPWSANTDLIVINWVRQLNSQTIQFSHDALGRCGTSYNGSVVIYFDLE